MAYTYHTAGQIVTSSTSSPVYAFTAVKTYVYDAVSRLSSLTQNLASTAYDQTLTFGSYNPASQIISRTASNDAYAWTGGVNAALDYTNNGKNQVTAVEAQTITYDARQNITGDGTATYAYNALNQMLTATLGGTTRNFSYDPAGRLYRSVGATTTRYLYDGVDLVMELDAAGTIPAPARARSRHGRAGRHLRRRDHDRPPLAVRRRAGLDHRQRQRLGRRAEPQ